MSNELAVRNEGFTILPENPYYDEFAIFVKRTKVSHRIISTEVNGTTIHTSRVYLPFGWIRLYQDKRILDLSPSASKMFLYIAINIDWNTQKVHIDLRLTGMDAKTASKAVVELLTDGILKKEKRSWYWVNPTLLIIGNPQLEAHGR